MSGLDLSKVAPWQPFLQHPTSIIPSFNYFTSRFSFLLLFDIPIVHVKSISASFAKALAQESGANVGVGQGQDDLAKEENLDVARGKCSKAEKRSPLEISGGRGNKCDLMRGIYQECNVFSFREKGPSPVLFFAIW